MRCVAAVLALVLIPGVSWWATADDNVPPDAVFQTTPADSDGRISGPSPLTVEFNLCRSRDADPGDDLKYSYDFDGDGGLDYFGHCRQSFTYRSDRSVPSCFWQPIVCVWDRVPFPGHQICRQYEVCVDGAAPAPAERIAFSRRVAGQPTTIYILNVDGAGLTPVVEGWMPTWSPEGRRLAFESSGNIFVVGVEGGSPRLVFGFDQGRPAWTPDGNWVASISDDWGVIGVASADGGAGARVVNVPDTCIHSMSYSPDGGRIAFTGFRHGPMVIPFCSQASPVDPGLYVMNADGSGSARLVADATAGVPAWSPDGSRIAFVSSRDGNAEIYVTSADGTGIQRLTTDAAFDTWPAWSPDGRQIAFQTNRDGNSEIYVMNADGSGARNLTRSPAEDSFPSWTAAR